MRESLRRVDPVGVEMRLRTALHRRQYNVPSPNALMAAISSLGGGL